jgi:hypothetical protein
MIWKGGHMSTMMSPVSRLAELFDSAGAGAYPGEPVTVAQHLLQAAALAEAAAAPPALVGGARTWAVRPFPLSPPPPRRPTRRSSAAGT